VQSALYDCAPRPRVLARVYGLGGRAITRDEICAVFDELDAEQPMKFRLMGVRD